MKNLVFEHMFDYYVYMLQMIDELDATATLRRAETAISKRRAAEIEDLDLVAHWADLHGDEPDPGDGRPFSGGDRLVQLGGEGTPMVQELCLHELAIARGTHALSTRAATADVLDLRHRLPECYLVFRAGDCDAWVARKVASMTRHLTRAQAALVDGAVAEALAGKSPARVLRIAEAKTIEADPEGHARRLEEALRRRFVGCSPSDEEGLRMVYARIEGGAAAWIDAIVDQLADILLDRPELRPDLTGDLPEGVSKDELRAIAFGLLAHPEEVIDLLTAARTVQPDIESDNEAGNEPDDRPDVQASPAPAPRTRRTSRRRRRNRALVYVHLHQSAVEGPAGVARVEDLGPMLLDQVRRLLGHAHVDVHPVIDLNSGASVDAYEHPESMTDRGRLRNPAEVFPHGSRDSRRTDSDHPDPYRPHGPPGQTRDTNFAPLGRGGHRAKTHLGYRLRQTGLDAYEWTTPHGLRRRVDRTGTHESDDLITLTEEQYQAILALGAEDRGTDLSQG